MLHKDPVQALLGNICHSRRNFYAREPPMGRWALIIRFQRQTGLPTEGVIWLLCHYCVCHWVCICTWWVVCMCECMCGYTWHVQAHPLPAIPGLSSWVQAIRKWPLGLFMPQCKHFRAQWPTLWVQNALQFSSLCFFFPLSSFFKRGSKVSQAVMCLLNNIFIYCPESLPINNMTDIGFYVVVTFFLTLWLKKEGKSC